MLNHQFQSLSNQVQKHSHWHPCSYRWWLAIFVFASSNWLTALSLSAATPPPGTVVDNQATGSFIEPINNTEIQIESNIVQVEIAEVAGITITGIATEEAPSNVNGAGTNQNDGNINPNDVVYFIYRIANVGNDPTQFFIPGAPSSITGGSLQGQIEIIAYDPDGSGDTAATDLSNPVPVPTEGISTGDPNALDLPNGSIPAEGTVTIRVPVKLDSTLSEGDTVRVVMGDTGSNDNSTETQNQVFIAGDRDVYTQDNPDGTAGEADGNPINGDATNQRREASYNQEVTVTLTTAPLDYGDAPDYTTAQIRINSDVYLGSTAPDADTGSWHDGTDDSENATDDDTNDTPSAITAGDDEEDSVAFGPLDITMAGNNLNQDVRVTNNSDNPAYVRAWIDFNRNDIFDPNEVSNEVTVAGNAGDTIANLSFSIPSDISSGPSFARVIVSDTPNIAIAGQGTGEIEDHIINIGDEDICNFVPNTTFSAFDFSNASENIVNGPNANQTSAVVTYRNAVVDLDGIPLDVRATVNATEGKINKLGNGLTDGRDASEWYLAIGNNNANTGSSAEVRLEFFIAGTNIPRAISGQFATGDIDDKPAPNGRLEALLLDTTDFSGYALDGGTTIENPYPEGNYTVFEGTGDRRDQPDSFVTYTFNNQNSVNLILRTTDVEGTPSAGFPINGRIASTKINNAECSSVVIPTDYSDAPTDSTNYGVAAHAIASGIQLGSAIDPDSGSLASANADGDDNNGTDDEDAFNTLPNVPTVGNYSLDVSVETTGNATLHGWIDFDKDGQFKASEYSSASVTSSGDIPLSWSVPAVTTPGDSYARFRLTSDTLTDDGTSDIDERSIGSASDGEVEDYPVTIELARLYDYGDAPDTGDGTGTGNYQTTANNGGAAQVVINDPTSGKVLSLGENVDPDSGNLENIDALADDEDGTPDDEDGIETFPTLTTAEGQTYTVSVTAKNNITEEVAGTQVGVPAYLVGFIDFNKDGDFTDPNTGLPDPGERSETVTISSDNSDLRTFDVTFNTPAGMTPGDTYARFRLGQVEATAQSAAGASAGTDNGEVEDYKVAIASSALITGNVCYSVADSGDTLTRIDRVTGAEVSIGDTGTQDIEAIAYSPLKNILYATNAGIFGTIDTSSGTFTAIGPVGSNLDIDGLTVDPYTGQVYGAVRRRNLEDLLIEINPTTGQLVPGAFANGSDSVAIKAIGGVNDIDDITIDPDDGQLYGIANGSGGQNNYVRIDRTDGTTTLIGSFGFPDVEGLTAFNDGNIYMTTGDQGIQFNGDNKFYSVNKTSGRGTEIAPLDIGYDYESVACLTGPPNSISGTVFLDSNNNAANDSESGTENVTVELYRDVNADGRVDSGDLLLTTQQTNSDGDYNFLFAATGAYVLAIDLTTLPEGNTLTTDNVEAANLNGLALSDTDNDFGQRAAPTSAPPPADSCPSSPIGLVDVGVSTDDFTSSGSGVGRQVRYGNVATVDGKALDMIGEVIALENIDDLITFGIRNGLPRVTLPSIDASEAIGTIGTAEIKYTFVEQGTTTPVPVSFEFEISDIDNNLRSNDSSRREYIVFPTSEFQDYFFADPTQMQAELDSNGILFSNSVPFNGNPGASSLNTVKFLINNRSSFTITFGVEKNTSDRRTGDIGFPLDGAILPQLGKCDRYDYGDAPDSDSDTAANNYQTLLANGGPAHKIIDGLFLGPQKPDADNNGTPTVNADGDDLSNTAVTFDDEDGVQLAGSELQGQTLEAGDSITLDIATQGSGVLNAWMDWNNDGDFLDADEKIATNAAEGGAQDSDNDTPGIQLNVTVPSGATVSNIFARFRYSTDNDLEPTGTANDGEVEDYQIAIAAASDPNLLLVKRITAINPGSSDEVQFNSFVNDDSDSDGDFDNDPDNDPNWPTDDNIYLRGATTVADVQPGDEVEYTIYFLSNGDEDATNVKICDVIPDNMSFVSNSYDGNSGIALLNSSASGATPTNLSNAEDTDEGRFYAPGAALPTAGDPPTNLCQKVDSTGNIISVGAAENINGAIVVEIESLPEVTSPGTPENSYGFIRFRAKVK